jgi:hypothetical protein
MVKIERSRLTPWVYVAYCCSCRNDENALKRKGSKLTNCTRCGMAKFCTGCHDQSFTTVHYCRELCGKQEKLKSLQASYVRAQRHDVVVVAARRETIYLHEELLWCAAQVGNCIVEMAHQTFRTIQEGAYLYDQALQLYQSTLRQSGLSLDRRSAIESQMLLLLVMLDRDDQVMQIILRTQSADRYTLLSPEEIRDLATYSRTMPYLIFLVKAKIFGLVRTMKPKLTIFLQTSCGRRIDEIKSELAGYLYGHGQVRVRNQIPLIAVVGSVFLLESRRRGIPLVQVILQETAFEKDEWPIIFRVEVPAVFWSVFRRFLLEHPEVHGSLLFLAEL